MYLLKAIPADFKVIENSSFEFSGGEYAYYSLIKEGRTTQDAIHHISSFLRVPLSAVNVGGNKDRTAITSQLVSVKCGPSSDLHIKGMVLRFLGRRDLRMGLGQIDGNSFEIVVRRLSRAPHMIKKMPNYFDDQRFGNMKNNHLVGKCILLRDFKKACSLMAVETSLPLEYLQGMDKSIVRLYVHAYQSYVFNRLLSDAIRSQGEFIELDYAAGKLSFPKFDLSLPPLPLVGFGSDLTSQLSEILKEDGLTVRDFIVRQLPTLSSDGEMRDAFVDISNLMVGSEEDDELNQGFKKRTVSFSLPKGSFATIAIRSLFADESLDG